jgi:DNA-3-methyladenine glycosylase II
VTQRRFEMVPSEPFDLDNQASQFGGWPRLGDGILMAFPVKGWNSSAAVVMRQHGDTITGDVHGAAAADAERAWQQALATVSLDVDGAGFVEIGRRDPVIGCLQSEYHNLRPALFHSPYEAACAFVIGHRITILQTRCIRQRLGERLGPPSRLTALRLGRFPIRERC